MARVTIDDVLREARACLSRLSPGEAHRIVADGTGTLVDIRTGEHRQREGRLQGAIEVSLNVLEWRLDPDSPSRHPDAPGLDELVIVICEQGYSSSLAAAHLQRLGFARATDVVGGFEAWVAARLPVIDTAAPSDASAAVGAEPVT